MRPHGDEDEEQLLEVRAMILRVPVGGRRGAMPEAEALVAVLTAEGDRGALVVQLLKAHLETPA